MRPKIKGWPGSLLRMASLCCHSVRRDIGEICSFLWQVRAAEMELQARLGLCLPLTILSFG